MQCIRPNSFSFKIFLHKISHIYKLKAKARDVDSTNGSKKYVCT